MKYRKFGNTGHEISAIAFGAMRLPSEDAKVFGAPVDEAEAIRIMRKAIDMGVNYLDTAYGYHSGLSEVIVGKALKDGYREKVKIATKSPLFSINCEEDFIRFFDTQQKRLEVDFIDFYLFHGINRKRWENVILKYDLLSKMEKLKKEGRIGHIGFSFHDDYDAFEYVLNAYNKWEFCQIQYNYMDIENQAGTKGLKLAHEKGLGVVVMEPLLGGKLATPTKAIVDIFKEVHPNKTPVEWALDFLWNQEEVGFALSGMSNMEQVLDNIAYAERSQAHMLNNKELETIEKAYQKFQETQAVACTKCFYCMPCPNNVDIPENFQLFNEFYMYDNPDVCHRSYDKLSKTASGNKSASACIYCKACESLCPQGIKISEIMPKVHETLKAV